MLLAELAPAALMSLTLSMPRVMVFMFIVSLFPPAVFPRTLRIAIAIGLTAPVAFGVFHQLGAPMQQVDIVAILIKESALGLALGLPMAGPVWAIQSVGAFIDNQRGANAAQQLTPFSQADASVIGAALLQALIVVLASSGILTMLYQLLLKSFEVWPVLHIAPDLSQYGFDLATQRFDDWVGRALLFAAPVIAVILLVDFAFALVSVFAPQLQAYFASMPIKSLAGIAVLAVYMVTLMSHGADYFSEMVHRQNMTLESVAR
jgi:type III secretion protein T